MMNPHSLANAPAVGLAPRVSAVALGVLCALAGATSFHALASDLQPATLEPVILRPSQTDFGGVGLMQMPSGRMAKEGEFHFGVNLNDDYHHYYTSIQLFDWFETTVRYTRIPDTLYNPNPNYSGDNLNTDKGIDIKLRLWEESNWLPETSIGIRDIGGTGLFDGEFIAGTKRLGPVDITLGVGWGYIGQTGNISNPFCKISDEYCDRNSPTKGTGGSIDFGRWFKGEASIFGGIEYQTPYQPLRLKIEYDANDYTTDYPVRAVNKPMPQHTPWNVGLVYQLGNWADAKLSYQRGDTLTFGVNLYTNFDDLQTVWRDEPKQALTGRPNQESTDWQAVAEQLDSNAGYQQLALYQQDDALVLTGEQMKYRDRKEAHDRAAAILANHAPEHIKTYKIVETHNGVNLTQAEFDAKAYKQAATYQYLGAQSRQLAYVTDPEDYHDLEPLFSHRERWNAGLLPVWSQSFGGPEAFYLFNLGFNAQANYWLTNNLEASGSIYVNLADNYDKFNYVEKDPHISNFAVPRVRTMFRAYVSDNPVRLNQLQLTWFAQPAQQVYTQMYAGYLETMFAGVGGEVLYRPLGKNWALGLDANLVTQRDPDSWFATFDEPFVYYDGYDASNCGRNDVGCQAFVLDKGTTGQLSAYYMPQWSLLNNTLFKVSAGKFLGGDNGVRVDFSKQFKSGMIVGAFATVTDLTTEEYGEGSYNKGFYVSIPFDMLTIKPSTTRGVFAWQPITRDGGQTLGRKYELFEVTNARSRWY
ncbi:YjbH domain-containing protein [Vibrio vulnificus]|uniref:YjbH domain-containing protein n=1 Tax=Vibrio vulnificus TaxID=672 RepID=UPI003ED856C6